MESFRKFISYSSSTENIVWFKIVLKIVFKLKTKKYCDHLIHCFLLGKQTNKNTRKQTKRLRLIS